MYKESLKNMPGSPDLIFAGDERMETYMEDTMMRGHPDAVLRARDEKEIKEALIYCNKNKIPLTLCASQTSMTGSSIANEGLLISTEKLEGLIDIEEFNGKKCASFRSGTVVSEAQKAVAEAGYFYPVAPTSRDECRIGANVSTNATGEDSFKYGPARQYVERLKIILADGSEKILKREPDEHSLETHNKGGYFTGWKNPIDLFIGSEGTLGFISEVTLRLLPPAADFFSALAPFPSNMEALRCLTDSALKKPANLRTLEYIDEGALKAMKTAEGIISFPQGTKALLYFKQEYKSEKEKEEGLNWLYNLILSFVSQEFADAIIVADNPRQKENFRLWRHHIPEWANEEGRKYWPVGGGKVGSDWWVPANKLLEMMEFFYKEAENLKLSYMAYAHLGRGHPHTNAIAKTKEDKERAHDTLLRCCRKSVELGGGVAGEHGIGKLHTDLMSLQYSPEIIEKMKNWKKQYDPHWILGRGNLFAI